VGSLHQKECEAELWFHAEGHCLVQNYFDPPAAAGGGQFGAAASLKGVALALPPPGRRRA